MKNKRTKQRKIKAYYKKVKQGAPQKQERKRVPVPKNFQGFPLSKCYFVSKVGKQCYMPPKYYGTNFCPNNSQEFNEDFFCKKCYLSPCIMEIHGESMQKEILTFSKLQEGQINRGELVATEEQRRDDTTLHILEVARKELGYLFNKTYAKKSIPFCVTEAVDEWLNPSSPGTVGDTPSTTQGLSEDGEDNDDDDQLLPSQQETVEYGMEDPELGQEDDHAGETEFLWDPPNKPSYSTSQTKSLQAMRREKKHKEFLRVREDLMAFDLWIQDYKKEIKRNKEWIKRTLAKARMEK